jgi:hypothetical protein
LESSEVIELLGPPEVDCGVAWGTLTLGVLPDDVEVSVAVPETDGVAVVVVLLL